jgi:hypothetical protein
MSVTMKVVIPLEAEGVKKRYKFRFSGESYGEIKQMAGKIQQEIIRFRV